MASPNIENSSRVGSQQTWKEIYEGAEKTTDSLERLNSEFADFVASTYEFSDTQKERLKEYLDSLEDISSNWEEINGWIKENSTSLDGYVGSLGNIRDIFKDVASVYGGIRRDSADMTNLARRISSLAGESVASIQQEAGITPRIVKLQERKATFLREQFEYRVKSLVGEQNLALENGKIVASDAKTAVALKEALDKQQRSLDIARTNLEILERYHPKERDRIRALREEVRYRETNLEYLRRENLEAVQGLEDRISRRRELLRIQRTGIARGNDVPGRNAMPAKPVNLVSKYLKKVGLGDVAEELEDSYNKWVTNRVDALERVEQATRDYAATVRNFNEQINEAVEKATNSFNDLENRIKTLPALELPGGDKFKSDLESYSEKINGILDLQIKLGEAERDQKDNVSELQQKLVDSRKALAEEKLSGLTDLGDSLEKLRDMRAKAQANAEYVFGEDLAKTVTKNTRVVLDRSQKEYDGRLNADATELETFVTGDNFEKQVIQSLIDAKTGAGEFKDVLDNIQSVFEKIGLDVKAVDLTEDQLNNLIQAKDIVGDISREAEKAGGSLGALTSGLETSAENLEEAKKYLDTVFSKKFEVFKLVKNVLSGSGGIVPLLALAGTLILGLWKNFTNVTVEASKLKQLNGHWNMSAAASNNALASSVQWLRAGVKLAEEFKIDPIQLFTPNEIGKMAEVQNTLGLSADQAANLAVRTKMAGTNADQYRVALTKGVNAGNAASKSAVSLGVATRAALNASDAITLSMGNNAEAIGKAATVAASLGMELKDIEGISQNLINFESSIQAEMQAQLLTGRQLNLAKAREYALNNDLEGVAKEISRQGITAAEYGKMNVIQQENLAKALGMSRDQMSRMLVQQYLSGQLSKEALMSATHMTAEQIEAMGVQERMKVAVQKLAQAFVPVLELLVPIAELVSNIVGWMGSIVGFVTSWGRAQNRVGVGLKDSVATEGSRRIGSTRFKGILGNDKTSQISTTRREIRGTSEDVKASGSAFENFCRTMNRTALVLLAVLGGAKLLRRSFRALAGSSGRVGSAVRRLAESFSGIRIGGNGGIISRIVRGIGSAFRSLGRFAVDIIKGAAAMAAIAGALWVFAKAAAAMPDFKKVLTSIVAIGALVGAVVVLGRIAEASLDAIAVGALAMVVIAGSIYVLGAALESLGRGLQVLQEVDFKAFDGIVRAMGQITLVGLMSVPAGNALMLGASALLIGAAIFVPAAALMSRASLRLKVTATNFGEAFESIRQAAKPEVGRDLVTFGQNLRAFRRDLVALPAGRIRRIARALSPLAKLGTSLSASTSALYQIGSAIGVLVANVDKLDSEKLQSLSKIRPGRFMGRAVSGLLNFRRATANLETGNRSESLRESQGKTRETIEGTYLRVANKQAESRQRTQRAVADQKSVDLSRIEQKMESLERTIRESRPDWNWLEFGKQVGRHTV